MDPFELPETLPTDAAGLEELRTRAVAWFEHLREQIESGGAVSEDQLAALRTAVEDLETLSGAIDEITEADQQRSQAANDLISRAVNGDDEDGDSDDTDATDDADAADDSDDDGKNTDTDTDDSDAVVEGDVVEESRELVTASATNAANRPARRRFTGIRASGGTPNVRGTDTELGWEMDPSAPQYQPGRVSFSTLAAAIDSIRPGARPRSNRAAPQGNTSQAAQTLARMRRDLEEVRDSHALVAAILQATDERRLPGGSLTAAGGWCAPSETLYDFCAVPQATDLLSMPEITIRRGGVRWPVEPDLSDIFANFEWFFCEPELEAVDTDGNPTAIKTCVEVPCPDEFDEIRLCAVGYCVEVGILQEQGWPELVDWFMQSLMQEHFRALSRRSIQDIVTNSDATLVIPDGTTIGTGSAILNSLALMATNLRLDKGLGRTATIEGIAPSWLPEVMRADLAMMQGVDTKNVTDAQITSWLSARNIALQYVGDWQTRDDGMPGNLQTVQWPATVDIVLYPAGTWFRALSPIIEFGAMYPRELLQVNRYTKFFTEDAIAIGKRCNKSIVVTIPICPSGAFGPTQAVDCASGGGVLP